MVRHSDQPKPNIPADWQNEVLHARVVIGETVLMGADIPQAEPMRSAYLSLSLETEDDAERVYALFADGGEVFMKMAHPGCCCTRQMTEPDDVIAETYTASMDDAGRAPVRGLVPMIHVSDVERSVTFYRLLGFQIGNAVPRGDGPKEWVWLYAPSVADWKRGPNLMLTLSSRPIEASAQDVLFYLYASDLKGLRAHLLNSGLVPGEIGYPEYLPAGEFRLEDPDGYCLMVAQSGPDTP